MITKGYGHVGRPTNEERKNKKKKNIILITILSVFIFILSAFIYLAFNSDTIDLSSLMGNSSSNSSTINDFDILVDGKPQTIISLKYASKKQLAVSSKVANQKVKWSSGNSKLVKVNQNGLITVVEKAVGITYIYATLESGYRESLAVKVYPTGDYVSVLKNNPSNTSLKYEQGYFNYKPAIGLKRDSVMQSFAIEGGYMYISQKQHTHLGAFITKVDNSAIDPYIMDGGIYDGDDFAVLKDYDHVGNIDFETTNGKSYLWTQCGSGKHCRVPLSNIKFIGSKIGTTKVDGKNKINAQEPSNVIAYDGVSYVAVDSVNKTVVTMGGTKNVPQFKVYDLDDYVASKGESGKLPSPIYSFSRTIKNNQYSRQGLDVDGNYIYSYEGNKSSKTDDKGNPIKGIFITVYKLDGTVVIDRLKVEYPDNKADWEPEGIKVYNGNLFIGMARIDKKTNNVTQYIFSVGKTVENLN